MNSIVLMAEIQSEPELRYTQDNLAVTSMLVLFPSIRTDEDPYQVRVAAFGELAQTVSSTCKIGDTVTIEGQLHINTVERDGRKEKVAEITARRIYPLSGGMAYSLNTTPDPSDSASSSSSSGSSTSSPSRSEAPSPSSSPSRGSVPPASGSGRGPSVSESTGSPSRSSSSPSRQRSGSSRPSSPPPVEEPPNLDDIPF